MSRLAKEAPDLVSAIERADNLSALRRGTLAFVEAAAARVGLEDPEVRAALTTLGRGELVSSEDRNAMLRRVEALDEMAWDLQDLVDEGKAELSEYVSAFYVARVANAVYFATDGNPRSAASEAAYEALASLPESDVARAEWIAAFLRTLGQ